MRHVWPLVGTVMLTVLLMADFIFDALNVLRSLIPATRLLDILHLRLRWPPRAEAGAGDGPLRGRHPRRARRRGDGARLRACADSDCQASTIKILADSLGGSS